MSWISANEQLPDNDESVFVMFRHDSDYADETLWYAQFKEGAWYGNEFGSGMVKLKGVPVRWHPIAKVPRRSIARQLKARDRYRSMSRSN